VSHVASSHTDTGIVLDHVNERCRLGWPSIYHRYADKMGVCRRCSNNKLHNHAESIRVSKTKAGQVCNTCIGDGPRETLVVRLLIELGVGGELAWRGLNDSLGLSGSLASSPVHNITPRELHLGSFTCPPPLSPPGQVIQSRKLPGIVSTYRWRPETRRAFVCNSFFLHAKSERLPSHLRARRHGTRWARPPNT
jgi:hypothetical protein